MSESLLDSAPLLPGLDAQDLPAPLTDEQINELPQYTAARLFQNDEQRYRLAVALFFGECISFRGVCRICHISCHTLQAIIRRESASHTAEEWREVASADIRASMYIIQRRIDELLIDDKAVKAAGIPGLATLVREQARAHEMLNQRLPGQKDSSALTPEQQAKMYIDAQTQARKQSIEVGEKSEPTRGANDADPAESEG